jgi:hypothetical protein
VPDGGIDQRSARLPRLVRGQFVLGVRDLKNDLA